VSAPPVVILCGGRGTRLREETQTIPKPLVEIGGRPILWHVIRIYAEQGFEHFVLCTGHKSEMIEDFLAHDGLPAGLEIDCVQTGEETPTGGRIARVSVSRTPTASPTSTSPRCSASTTGTARSPP
jgi:glucose-1-phosphate cytidylyltransferase